MNSGFVNLGSVQNSMDDLEKCLSATQNSSTTPDEATHIFVFMAVNLFSDWKMPVAFLLQQQLKRMLCSICFGNALRNWSNKTLKYRPVHVMVLPPIDVSISTIVHNNL